MAPSWLCGFDAENLNRRCRKSIGWIAGIGEVAAGHGERRAGRLGLAGAGRRVRRARNWARPGDGGVDILWEVWDSAMVAGAPGAVVVARESWGEAVGESGREASGRASGRAAGSDGLGRSRGVDATVGRSPGVERAPACQSRKIWSRRAKMRARMASIRACREKMGSRSQAAARGAAARRRAIWPPRGVLVVRSIDRK